MERDRMVESPLSQAPSHRETNTPPLAHTRVTVSPLLPPPTFACVCVCVCTHTHTHMYRHTHTHTHTQKTEPLKQDAVPNCGRGFKGCHRRPRRRGPPALHAPRRSPPACIHTWHALLVRFFIFFCMRTCTFVCTLCTHHVHQQHTR